MISFHCTRVVTQSTHPSPVYRDHQGIDDQGLHMRDYHTYVKHTDHLEVLLYE